jgi:hypothetical protein
MDSSPDNESLPLIVQIHGSSARETYVYSRELDSPNCAVWKLYQAKRHMGWYRQLHGAHCFGSQPQTSVSTMMAVGIPGVWIKDKMKVEA